MYPVRYGTPSHSQLRKNYAKRTKSSVIFRVGMLRTVDETMLNIKNGSEVSESIRMIDNHLTVLSKTTWTITNSNNEPVKCLEFPYLS